MEGLLMLKKSVSALSVVAFATAVAMSSGAAASTMNNTSPQLWWPDRLDLSQLRDHDPKSNPMGDFDDAEAVKKADFDAVKKDMDALLTDSQDRWRADYGHYGPFFIRMAWPGAATYRIDDGRGGADGSQQRFDRLNS